MGQRAKKGVANLQKAAKKVQQKNEEVESINELKSRTMLNYIDAASRDAAHLGWMGGASQMLNKTEGPQGAKEFGRKEKKRLRGIDLATKKLRRRTNEEVEQLDELGGISTLADESKNVETTTDTLVGRKKGGGVNQHGPDRKIKLNAESKRPEDGVPFVTNEEGKKTPFSLAKELARKSFNKIRQETMMGKAGTTSEDKE